MIPERQEHLLRDIRKHCEFILEDTKNLNLPEYIENRVVRQSIERSLTIVGIAAVRLRDLDEDLFSEVDELHAAIGLRNRLAHGYDDDLNDELIWHTATVSIPRLLHQIEELF